MDEIVLAVLHSLFSSYFKREFDSSDGITLILSNKDGDKTICFSIGEINTLLIGLGMGFSNIVESVVKSEKCLKVLPDIVTAFENCSRDGLKRAVQNYLAIGCDVGCKEQGCIVKIPGFKLSD